jgi:hypothetical protein
MGKVKEPLPVKLIASMFTTDTGLLEEAKVRLSQEFGPVDYESELLPFDHTDYYTPEFGEDLKRKFVAFEELIHPGRLAEIKLRTNALEIEWAAEGKRRINIDPGYVSHSKLVLATTKDYAHRIYLGQGIYAEVTLHFRGGTFQPWPWTYPDYASSALIAIFNQIRGLYVKQCRETSCVKRDR